LPGFEEASRGYGYVKIASFQYTDGAVSWFTQQTTACLDTSKKELIYHPKKQLGCRKGECKFLNTEQPKDKISK